MTCCISSCGNRCHALGYNKPAYKCTPKLVGIAPVYMYMYMQSRTCTHMLTLSLMRTAIISTCPASSRGLRPSSTSLMYWFSSGWTQMCTGMLYLRLLWKNAEIQCVLTISILW